LVYIIWKEPKDASSEEEYRKFFEDFISQRNGGNLVFYVGQLIQYSYTLDVSDDFVNDALDSDIVMPVGSDGVFRYIEK